MTEPDDGGRPRKSNGKVRADLLAVEQGLAPSRERARARSRDGASPCSTTARSARIRPPAGRLTLDDTPAILTTSGCKLDRPA